MNSAIPVSGFPSETEPDCQVSLCRSPPSAARAERGQGGLPPRFPASAAMDQAGPCARGRSGARNLALAQRAPETLPMASCRAGSFVIPAFTPMGGQGAVLRVPSRLFLDRRTSARSPPLHTFPPAGAAGSAPHTFTPSLTLNPLLFRFLSNNFISFISLTPNTVYILPGHWASSL